MFPPMNNRYTLQETDTVRYDFLEVHGVRDQSRNRIGTEVEVDNASPQFYSVFAHAAEGGMECLGDFSTRELALVYANELNVFYKWPVTCHTTVEVGTYMGDMWHPSNTKPEQPGVYITSYFTIGGGRGGYSMWNGSEWSEQFQNPKKEWGFSDYARQDKCWRKYAN